MELNIETDDGTAVVDADGDQPYKDAQFALGRLLDEAGEIDPVDLERVYVVLQSDTSADDAVVPVREQLLPASASSQRSGNADDAPVTDERPSAGDRSSAQTSDNSDTASTSDTETEDAVVAGDGGVADESVNPALTGPDSGPPSTADRGGARTQEFLSETDRELGTIMSGSTHHVVLSLLDGADGRLQAKEVKERFPEAADSTTSGVLSMLYKRRLANRERLSNESGVKHEYWVAPHGQTALDDMGTITPEEWASQ
jgi:hypothetical protein